MYMCEPIKNILQRLPNEIRLFKEIANLLDDTMRPCTCGVWLNESARRSFHRVHKRVRARQSTVR